MASPHASSFICLPFSDHSDMVTAYTVYFGVCIGSALIGVFGAAIFLTQVIRTASDGYTGKATSQRWILIMLAVSDLFADLGVIGRSAYWLIYWRPRHISQLKDFSDHLPPAVGASVVEHWVFFWYLATYFWTFFFAVDVYNSKHGGRWRLSCSHYFTWFFSIVFVTGSAASLWACPPFLSCLEDRVCIITHFMSTLGPMVVFMVALPIFYISTWRKMKKNAQLPSSGVTGPVADIWKKDKQLSKRKILSIILVFYLCWSINVIDGLLLIVAHATMRPMGEGCYNTLSNSNSFYRHVYDSKYVYGVWLLEAIMNPLQGLFNAIAYGGVCTAFWTWLCRKFKSLETAYTSSWSGEYIDVDFRVGRGKIHHTKRKNTSLKT